MNGMVFASVPAGPGSSGGPLINRRGEVVGITTWQFLVELMRFESFFYSKNDGFWFVVLVFVLFLCGCFCLFFVFRFGEFLGFGVRVHELCLLLVFV